jgi:hypothetical protein
MVRNCYCQIMRYGSVAGAMTKVQRSRKIVVRQLPVRAVKGLDVADALTIIGLGTRTPAGTKIVTIKGASTEARVLFGVSVA